MTAACICPTCGLAFRSPAGFDMHRVGPFATLPDSKHGAQFHARRCLSVAEMTERGMARNERGQWTTAAMPAHLHADDEPAA